MAALALAGPGMAQPPPDQGEGSGAPAAEQVKPEGAPRPAQPPAVPAPVRPEPQRDPWTPLWKGLAGLGFASGAGSLAALFWGGRKLRRDIDRIRDQLRHAEQQLAGKATGSDLRTLKGRFSDWAANMPAAIDAHLQKPDHREDSWVQRVNSWAQETHRRAAESSALMAQLHAELQELRQQLDHQQQVLERLPEGLRTDLPSPPPQEAGGEEEAAAAEAKRLAVQHLLERYREAALQRDRNRIRAMADAELNITQASEDALTRGTGSHRTQLQTVSGGGSYLLVVQDGRNWIFPTIQTLSVLATSRAQKGIFDYEYQPVSAAELKQPAEAQPAGDSWEVISPGIVILPA